MTNPPNPFTAAPLPGGQANPPEWCLRQFSLLMVLIGVALFIWSL